MQAATILAALQRAAQAPALAGIYIKGVALAAPKPADLPAVLTVTWSMPDASVDRDDLSQAGVAARASTRPADTLISVPRELASLAEIEDAILGAAWTLGAWDVVRCERPQLAAGEDWGDLRHGIAGDFGCGSYAIMGQPLAVGACEPESAADAAISGYVTWRFVPLALATPTMRRMWASKDSTLSGPDCTRAGDPWHARMPWAHPAQPGLAHDVIYRLGRGNHGNRSKSSKERRA